MTVNRTTLLDLPLPVTGTESGTWGDTTNNGLTQYLDIAIAGTLVLSTDADVTLTSTEGDSSATNIGATTAQYAILRWTATGSTTRNITALAQSKTYVVINATGGTQSIVLRGAGPTTGVTIISGEKAFCVWNGSDFVKVSSSAAAGGSNTQVQYNSSGVLAGSSNMTFNGTKLTVAGFLDSALTSGRVPYATTSGELTDSANLLYSGTDLTVYGITVGRGAGAVSTNTAVGASALAGSGGFNTAVGYFSLSANTSGTRAVAIGYNALSANTTGDRNHAIGLGSMTTNTTGNYNTAVGYGTLAVSNSDNNSAFGYAVLQATTSGTNNTGIGFNALYSNTTASYNTAVGYQAAYANTTGTLTALGALAGYANTTGASNTAIGGNNGSIAGALQSNTTGSFNTAVGTGSLASNTTAFYNTAVGYQAMYANTTGPQGTAVGYQALSSTTTTGYSTAMGYQAAQLTTTGIVAAFGQYVLRNNTTGNANAGFGGYDGSATQTLASNTTGSYNSAFGMGALASNTTASYNTAVGYQAGYSGSGTNFQYNTFVGYRAGYSANPSVSSYGNVCIGSGTGQNLTTGYANTIVGAIGETGGDPPGTSLTTGIGNNFIGTMAGNAITTGSQNTILGSYTGNNGGLDIRTADNYIVLSDGDGNPRGYFDNSGNFTVPAAIRSVSGTTASLGLGGTATVLSISNLEHWMLTANGNGNTTQFAQVMVYCNAVGGVTVTSIVSVGISITASGANTVIVTNGATTQTVSYSAIRIK